MAPRGPRYPKVVVLVGRWTGSMGEGLAIGFDALCRATVVGTEMAQLNGAIYSYRLPHSGINFSIPVERLYHVDGRPREACRPLLTLDLVKAAQGPSPSPDPVMKEALSLLEHKD